jgi:flavin reductase (DIM6/NTAB) family NADH-FMN oxidoreductase RutF
MTVALPSSLPPAADAATLKLAMRSLSGGVTVVTAGRGEGRTGATVTSATSLSLDPPTMIVNINLGSSTWPAIRDNRHFAVNVLAEHDQPVADRFAGRGGLKGPARYEGADWVSLVTGAPVLVGALAAVDCELEEAIERHSHAIVLGRVRAVTVLGGPATSLVYAGGRYGRFAG